MELRKVKITELKAAEYNPRVTLYPGDPEFEKLKKSIQAFGDVEPIVWNERTGNVVGGHQRLAVLKNMGEDEVTVSVVNLDSDSEKLLNVALNKIKGAWDMPRLESLLSEIGTDDAYLAGFNANELSIMLSDNVGFSDDDFDDYILDDEEDEEETTTAAAGNGMSYIVTLIFDCNYYAQTWAADNGFAKAIKDGARTTVIRMPE